MATKMRGAAGFFYEHAGYCYDPVNETREQGRRRCARRLAEAEAWLASVPHQIEWCEDPHADRSYMAEDDGRPLYRVCVSVKNGDGEWEHESLCGIDLGPTGNECDSYMRVVVAELASQHMA